jgi:DNA-directed RNA polymerase specialized sigma24 family protein
VVLRTFQQCLAAAPAREAALLLTYREHGITMTALAAELGLSVTRQPRVHVRRE